MNTFKYLHPEDASGLELRIARAEEWTEGQAEDIREQSNQELHLCLDFLKNEYSRYDSRVEAFLGRIYFSLGYTYRSRQVKNRAQNLEDAIDAYRNALQIYTHAAAPLDWANTQNNLGLIYNDRIRGDRAQNIEDAINAFQNVSQVYTREAAPIQWAATQNNLGIVYGNRIQGDRAQNLEDAINAYKNALTVRTREAVPLDWAATQNNLGTAYGDRIRGDRAQNIEDAIDAYKNALTVRTREAVPIQWATTQNNLGAAYGDRIRGDRAQNIEDAIDAYKNALQVYTREGVPIQWAAIQNNLGTAYRNRIQGDQAQNLEDAIDAYKNALTVRTREAVPLDWAATQSNLGAAYGDRIRGDRAQNIEDAIDTFQNVSHVYTREAAPLQWAFIQNNLGIAYGDRVRGDQAQNLEDAINAYKNALTVRTREAVPLDWAATQSNLGTVYNERIRGERTQNLEDAIDAFENALQVYTREAIPLEYVRTSFNQGNSLSAVSRFQEARSAYESVAIVLEQQRFQVISHDNRRLLAQSYESVYAEMLALSANLNDPEWGFESLSQVKGRGLTDRMFSDPATLLRRLETSGNAVAADTSARLRHLFNERRQRGEDLSSLMLNATRAGEQLWSPESNSETRAALNQGLQAATRQTQALQENIAALDEQITDLTGQLVASDPTARALSLSNGLLASRAKTLCAGGRVLVEYALIDSTWYAFVIQAGSVRQVVLPEELQPLLSAFQQHQLGYPQFSTEHSNEPSAAYTQRIEITQSKEVGRFNQKRITALLRQLYQYAVEPLGLPDTQDLEVVVGLGAALHQVPLAAATAPDGLSWLERHRLTFSYSLNLWAARAEVTRAENDRMFYLVSHENTEEMEQQYEMLRTLYPDHLRLSGDAASLETVLATLPNYGLVYIEAHSNYLVTDAHTGAWIKDPVNGGIQLQEGKPHLTAQDLISLDLSRTHTVTMAVCESALRDTDAGEDALGLAPAFLVAGAESVVATLWMVDIDSAEAFYQAFFKETQQGHPVDLAWRTATKAVQQAGAERSMEGLGPWAHPFHWAAYVPYTTLREP
ncbi:CHAT domain-containing protein (plasmid) [Deinococcus sp. KNUC1210]|uniref:CHAT domain-containing protein n=1 Tax=Deinococcus sp. KNUC1210 TaxID=2917691 RepID=UPI001EEF9EA0|nr:CHAT domain-containing protein [Deinococcus sp. KNUC1210]ULH14027.1 CHAT domain-containing protein [Deinococcus sp. KNUC1210]